MRRFSYSHKLGGRLPSEQRGMEAGALLEWRRMAMV
jgi:hypothetical protein